MCIRDRCLATLTPSKRTWSHPRKIFDADCTNSYVFNSGVTDPNLTKFLQDVEKWMSITILKSELRSSNTFRNARVPNEDRSSNCGRVAAKIVCFNSINDEIIGQKFTKFVHDVAGLFPFILLKAASRSSHPLSNAMFVSGDVYEQPLNLTGCHSNVP